MVQKTTIWSILFFAACGHLTFAQGMTGKESFDVMADDTTKFLISWAQSTFGFSLSKDERILYSDESVIVVGKNEVPSWVVSTYNFSPAILSTSLQMQLNSSQSLIINAFGMDATVKFHQIPSWLGDFAELKSLALWNADLSALVICKGFPISYLDLRRVRYADSSSLIEVICSLKDLELFIHDDSISDDVISTLKERLPNMTFIKKGK